MKKKVPEKKSGSYILGFKCNQGYCYLKSYCHFGAGGEYSTTIQFTDDSKKAIRYDAAEVIRRFNGMRKWCMGLEIMEMEK